MSSSRTMHAAHGAGPAPVTRLSQRDRRDADKADCGVGLAIVVLLHVVVIAAVLQIGAVREALRETAPLFVSFVVPEAPKADPEPPAPPPPPKPRPKPPAPSRLITSEQPVTTPAEFVAPPAPVEEQPVARVAAEAPAAPAPAAPAPAAPAGSAAPKVIIAVQYVRPPRVVYPMASRRLGEQGRVVVRVLIDRSGHAERVELHQASRHPRLNDAALKAARDALYRPYSENGEPQVVWALVPVLFELSN